MTSSRENQTPYQRAMQMYRSAGKCFEEVLTEYLTQHYIYVDPTCFILAKPIYKVKTPKGDQDAWFVECAVGEHCLQRFINLMPFFLPNVAFARGLREKQLKFYNTDKLKGHL